MCFLKKKKKVFISLEELKGSPILTRLHVLTNSQQATPLTVGSHVTNCKTEYQNTCKFEADVNYCFSRCACCCVETAHFICSTIITSCWHRDCWHRLTTPVGPLSPKGGTTSCQQRTRFDLASGWALNYESGRRLAQRGLKGDRQPHSTVWSQLAWTYHFY